MLRVSPSVLCGACVVLQTPDDLLKSVISSHVGDALFPALRAALQQRHEESVIAANAIRLMSDLPSYSHLRRPLLSYLTAGLDTSRAATLFGVSPSAVRHALKEGFDADTTDLFAQYPHDVKRQKLNTLEQECIVDFIKTMCPVKSINVMLICIPHYPHSMLLLLCVCVNACVMLQIG